MSSDLPNSKLAELAKSLSGKDCALLVIGYFQQERKDGKEYREEIRTIAACISPYGNDKKRQEYLFYYELWWNMTMFELDLQTCMLDLQCMYKQLQGIAMGLAQEAVNYHNLLLFRWMPKIYSEKQFEDLYNKERTSRLAEILPLDEIARNEAFLRLKNDDIFPKESFIEEVDEKNDKWKKAIEEELTRLRAAVKNGKLKQAKVTSDFGWYHNGKNYLGQDGITAQSWYDYSDKLDKTFNTHLDNKGELVEWVQGRYVIAKEGTFLAKLNKSNIANGEENRQQYEIRLKNILTIKEEGSVLDFEDSEYKELVLSRLKNAQEWIQRLLNHLEVVSIIEQDVFNKEISVNKLKDQAKILMAQAVEEQNKSIPVLLGNYNVLRKHTKGQFTFKNEQKYKLNGDLKPDIEWVDDTVRTLIDLANRESGYGYQLKS